MSMLKVRMRLLLLMFLSVFCVIYLSVDFYQTFFHGETLRLRESGSISFDVEPLFFIFTVVIKLAFYVLFIFILCESYKELRENKTCS